MLELSIEGTIKSMSKIIIGRYIPGNSVVYRMDPRSKIIGTFLFVFLMFLANNWLTYTLLIIFTLVAIGATKLKPKLFWNGVKPVIWLILFTSVLQMFFTTGGHTYWRWGFLKVTQVGLENAIYLFLRFVMIICVSTVLTLTTPSLQIADALQWIMKPLKIIRVPVDQLALVMAIALRFVPTLMDQTVKIMNAQRARGIDFSSGSLLKRIKNIIPILIPLFITSMTTALDLATAMEARGYQENKPRSHYRILSWTKADLILLGYFLLLIVGLVVFRTK